MQFSERQERTVASALTTLAALVLVGVVLGLCWAALDFLHTFSHVFLPLAVAGIGALVFQPYYDLLRVRARLPVPLAIAALILSLLIPIVLLGVFFGILIARGVTDLVAQLPHALNQLIERLHDLWPELGAALEEKGIGQRIAEAMKGRGAMLASWVQSVADTSLAAGAGLTQWAGSMLGWAVAPVYFVFFLIIPRIGPDKLEGYLPFLKEDTRKDVVFLVREFVSILVAFFRGQLLIGFLQGVLFGIGFSICGLKYGLILGLVLGLLNIIPYLGSLVGLSVTLPLAYFQEGGGLSLLIGVIIVMIIVQMIEGYVLTPRIMGNQTGLHPMVIILAVFFWGSALGGIAGMILAIPLTAFLVVLWRLAKEKYITELV